MCSRIAALDVDDLEQPEQITDVTRGAQDPLTRPIQMATRDDGRLVPIRPDHLRQPMSSGVDSRIAHVVY